MKKIVVLFFPLFLCFGCNEIPIGLGSGAGGPVSAEVVKKVLIEEFTGVRCVNCPAGSEFIEELLDLHDDRLVAVSIHAGEWADSFDESTHEFNTVDGDRILNFIGVPQGYPSATVNRKVFGSEQSLQLDRTKWAGYIDQELSEEAVVDINLSKSIIEDGVLRANVEIDFLIDASLESPKLSLIIVENNIKDPQVTPDGVVIDYNHKHVLRDIVTPFDGEDVDGASTEAILKSYELTIPSDWNPDELSIIAIIHNSTTNKEILQVEDLEF